MINHNQKINGKQKLTKVEIESDGRILHFPDGFMQEWDKSLDILLDL